MHKYLYLQVKKLVGVNRNKDNFLYERPHFVPSVMDCEPAPPSLPENEKAAPSQPPRGEEIGRKANVLTPLLHNSLTPEVKSICL